MLIGLVGAQRLVGVSRLRDVVTSVLRGALPSVLLPIRRVLIVAIIRHAALGVAELGTV